MEKENKLQVQQYDASEVEAKKKKILKKVATGVGAAALVTVLGYYGLAQDAQATEPVFIKEKSDTVPAIVLDTVPVAVKQDLDIKPITTDTIDIGTIVLPMGTFMLGGGGAWFNSVIEFLEA
jgi:hypothetical protein